MGHPHHYGKPVCSEKKGQGVMGGALAVCCKYQHEFRGKEESVFLQSIGKIK